MRIGHVFSDARQLEDGVPQGIILSVSLLMLLVVLYMQMTRQSPSLKQGWRRLQLALNKILEWADTRGFRFSAAKTVSIHFVMPSWRPPGTGPISTGPLYSAGYRSISSQRNQLDKVVKDMLAQDVRER